MLVQHKRPHRNNFTIKRPHSFFWTYMINTQARQRAKKAHDKATDNLTKRGWTFDGLWYHSPYTKHRYSRHDAVSVEELRAWSESDSAFLNDKNHSMWVKAEEDDCRLITMEEAAENCRKRHELRELGKQ